MTQPGPDAWELVGRDAGTDSAATENDPPLGVTRLNRLGDGCRKIRKVIFGIETVSALVDHVMAQALQHSNHVRLQRVSAVVCADRYFHILPACLQNQ